MELLRLLVNERLAAAAEEIFGLVEKTVAEYQEEAARSKREVSQLRKQLRQLTHNPEVILLRADAQLVSEERHPSLQQCDVKVEQIPDLEETEIQEHPQVKEEQADQHSSLNTEGLNNVRLPNSASAEDCELFPSSPAAAVGADESADEHNESDGSPWPHQSQRVEVFLELEQPPRQEKSCRFCGKSFLKDAHLIRHVDTDHKGGKAFKCLECKKEFDTRYQLVLHTRVHTGEKPFKCDHCDKTFSQNSNRISHMRVHTEGKPYFCAKCGKNVAKNSHFKFCGITPRKGKEDEDHKKRVFKCPECRKAFATRYRLIQHMRVHEDEKPFTYDFCGKTCCRSSSRNARRKWHTGEKPYVCKARGRGIKYCTATSNKSTKSFFCLTCGRAFHTYSDLKMHMEVHKSLSRYIPVELRGQDFKERG